MEHHWNELLKFSRRTEHQMNRWAARYGYKNNPKDILDHAELITYLKERQLYVNSPVFGEEDE